MTSQSTLGTRVCSFSRFDIVLHPFQLFPKCFPRFELIVQIIKFIPRFEFYQGKQLFPKGLKAVFGPGNGSLTLTHLVVVVVVVVVVLVIVIVVLGLTLFEKSLRLLHFLFKFLQISSHNPL